MNYTNGFYAVFLSLLLVSTASAQEINPDNFLTIDDEDEVDVNTIIHSFDDSTSLVNYDFDTENGTRLLIKSDIPRRIEVYDVNGFTEKGGEGLPINEYTLKSGLNEILIDATSKRGDKTLFMMVGDNYYVQSNNRVSALIGTPDNSLGFIFGIVGGGLSVLMLIIGRIKYKERKIDKNGVRLH